MTHTPGFTYSLPNPDSFLHMTLTAIVIGGLAIFLVGLLILVARRAIRLVIKLALFGLLLLVVLVGGLVIWWNGRTSTSEPTRENRPPSSRRAR